jgi:hypothetical protein
MNKKDIRSLREAYDEVASYESAPEEHIGLEVRQADSHDEGNADLESLEHEKISMVETRLRSSIAHAHQALDAIKKGSVIEPWMQDLITTAEEHIIKVANVLVYRHDID